MQLEDYTTGTVSIDNGSATLTGSGTAWDVAGFKAGDTFHAQGMVGIIASVDSDTAITLRDVWAGTTITAGDYLLRYQPDSSRMQGTTRQVLDELRQGIWLTPDATGKTADKATYDARPAGFRFLDVSVDPFKLYVKESDTSGDWSSGADWVGPKGDPGSSNVVGTSMTSLAIATGSKTFTIAETDRGWGVGARLRASSDADGSNWMEGVVTAYAADSLTLDVDLIGGTGTKADWTINLIGQPGKSFEWQNDWTTGTDYAVDDVVAQSGSSYICVTAHTAGTFTTDLSAGKWGLMAQKGDGDMTGPSSATDGNLPVFDGSSDKLKDSGVKPSDFASASDLTNLSDSLADVATSGSYNDLIDRPEVVFPGFIIGLTGKFNSASPDTKVDFSAGSAASDDATPVLLTLSSGLTKDISAAWAAGDGNGGLDTGSVAADTAYSAYLIGGAGKDTDILLTATYGAPTMPTGYTLKRYLGQWITDADGDLLPVTQVGNFFRPKLPFPVETHSVSSGAATMFDALHLPVGVSVLAFFNGRVINSGANAYAYVHHPDDDQIGAALTVVPLSTIAGIGTNTSQLGNGQAWSDTSGRLAVDIGNDGTAVTLCITGWMDPSI